MWWCREYEKITVDYPLAAAKAFAGLTDPFTFVYVSGTCPPESPFTPQI